MTPDPISPTVSNAKRCAQCDAEFTANRSTATYCSNACRQAHHRGDPRKTWRPCQGDDCPNEIPPWMRADARFCSTSCRDHDYWAYSRPILPRSWNTAETLADIRALADDTGAGR